MKSNTDDIIVIKLVSGENLVCRFAGIGETHVSVLHPLIINEDHFNVWNPFSDDDLYKFRLDHTLAISHASDWVCDLYAQLLDSLEDLNEPKDEPESQIKKEMLKEMLNASTFFIDPDTLNTKH